MVESHSQPASVGSEPEIETGPATQSVTILGLRFKVHSPTLGNCSKPKRGTQSERRLQSVSRG
jgi:hypothetical protein